MKFFAFLSPLLFLILFTFSKAFYLFHNYLLSIYKVPHIPEYSSFYTLLHFPDVTILVHPSPSASISLDSYMFSPSLVLSLLWASGQYPLLKAPCLSLFSFYKLFLGELYFYSFSHHNFRDVS